MSYCSCICATSNRKETRRFINHLNSVRRVNRRYVVVSNRGCGLSNNTLSSSSRRFSDTCIVCNHGLQGLSGDTAHSEFTSGKVSSESTTNFLSCGECNILGNYGRRGSFFAASSHADFSDSNNETMETDSFSFSSSNSQFFPNSLRSSSFADNNSGKTLSVNKNNIITSFSNSRTSFDNNKDALLLGNTFLFTRSNASPGAFVSFTSYRPFSSYTPFSSYSPHDTNWIVVRRFHTGSKLCEESKSKAEETVKALIEEAKEKLTEKDKPKPKEERKNVEDHVVQALKPTPKPGKNPEDEKFRLHDRKGGTCGPSCPWRAGGGIHYLYSGT